mmetsp:Transcript_26313/g.30782  ORF Transcript_26313/g.30782 Transcript_26313/m.30782 type:complete len:169 (-) Transcript_26313:867-1373(-)
MTFRDTGCGISPENQKKLFMNFGKLQESEQQNKTGVGLGLSICREIINAQGGQVDIHSEEGKGTDFIIKLQAQCRVDEQQLQRAQQVLQSRGYLSPNESSAEEFAMTQQDCFSEMQDYGQEDEDETSHEQMKECGLSAIEEHKDFEDGSPTTTMFSQGQSVMSSNLVS